MQIKNKQSDKKQNTRCIRGKTLLGKKPRALSCRPTNNQTLNQMKVTRTHPFPSWWLNLRTVLTCRLFAVHLRHTWTDHLECLFKIIQPRMIRRTPMIRTSYQQNKSFGENMIPLLIKQRLEWRERCSKVLWTSICVSYIGLGHHRIGLAQREKIFVRSEFFSTQPLERMRLLPHLLEPNCLDVLERIVMRSSAWSCCLG